MLERDLVNFLRQGQVESQVTQKARRSWGKGVCMCACVCVCVCFFFFICLSQSV